MLLSLWKYSERQKEITIHKGLEIVNEFCASHGEKTMIPEEYQRILDELVVLKCIDIEEDTIYLREKARHKYR